VEKVEKERNTKTSFFCHFGNEKKRQKSQANSRKVSSHAGKTSISEMRADSKETKKYMGTFEN